MDKLFIVQIMMEIDVSNFWRGKKFVWIFLRLKSMKLFSNTVHLFAHGNFFFQIQI
jgi:hypothetical protein